MPALATATSPLVAAASWSRQQNSSAFPSMYTRPFQLPTPTQTTGQVLPVNEAQPTQLRFNKRNQLQARQTIVELVIVTVVTVVASSVGATPTAITVTVPPASNTLISNGGWPIINPGSAGACWADTACNSVCPNFQQNGWYSGCLDAACSQCRCQIIESSMCYGVSWGNATGYPNGGIQTVTLYNSPVAGGAVATVTVLVGGVTRLSRGISMERLGWMITLCLAAWILVSSL